MSDLIDVGSPYITLEKFAEIAGFTKQDGSGERVVDVEAVKKMANKRQLPIHQFTKGGRRFVNMCFLWSHAHEQQYDI